MYSKNQFIKYLIGYFIENKWINHVFFFILLRI